MLPEDIKRLQREADIAAAIRGPDYRQRDEAVRAVKAEAARRAHWAGEVRAAEQAAYWEAVKRGDLPAYDEFGRIRPGREAQRQSVERERLAKEELSMRQSRKGPHPLP